MREMKRMRKVDMILVNSFSPFWFPQCWRIYPPGPTFTVVLLVCMDSSVFELSVISALALRCGFVTGISTFAILYHLWKGYVLVLLLHDCCADLYGDQVIFTISMGEFV
jgi:hypothetical protein